MTRIQAAASGRGVQYVKFESVKNEQTEEAPLRRVNDRTIAAGSWLLGWAEGGTYFSWVFAFLSLIKVSFWVVFTILNSIKDIPSISKSKIF